MQPDRNIDDLRRTVRKMSSLEFALRGQAILDCTKDELKRIIQAKKTCVLDCALAMIMLEAIKSGDHKRLEFLIERILGKVKDRMEVLQPKPTMIKRANGEMVELGTKMPDGSDND